MILRHLLHDGGSQLKKWASAQKQIPHHIHRDETGTAISDLCLQFVVDDATFSKLTKELTRLGLNEFSRGRQTAQ